jgi:two-component system CheB/CheR fusion protein
MPYRTLDDKVDGVVITFFNISDLKEVEVKLHETVQINRYLMKSASEIIIKLSTDLNILEVNPSAEKFLGKKQSEMINKNFIHTFVSESLRKKTEKEMKKIFSESKDTRFNITLITDGGKLIETDWSVMVLLDNNKAPSGMILSIKKS